MAEAGSATKQRILKAGIDLLSTDGFAGVTLGVLAERVGMSKSGLFAHFKAKEEVELGLIEQVMTVAKAQVLEPAMQAAEGLPRLRVFMSHWLGWFSKAGLPGGCPMAASFFEFDDLAGEVRDNLDALDREWMALLKHLTLQAVEQGHLQKNLDVDHFVWQLRGIYLNHHVSLRFNRDPRADRNALLAWEQLIERSWPVSQQKQKKRTGMSVRSRQRSGGVKRRPLT